MKTSFGHRSAPEARPSIARRLQSTTNAEKTHFISTRRDGETRRWHTFAAVEAIGRALPDVEVTTAWGQPALKVHGKMFALDALRDLVAGAHSFVNARTRSKSDAASRRGTARPSHDRR